MDYKGFFKKYGIHFIAIALFVIVGRVYFAPQFGEYGIKQHDVEQFKGMSNEVVQYREITGEEPMWTNSMFGGMPATQISIVHKGNFVKSITTKFLGLFPIPFGAFFLHLICFYIFALLIRIKPVIAILGAFVFAFASYEIIILSAGHNTKSIAVAYLPAVLGAFIYAFKTNWKIGTALSALFMAFEISANHLQVTYYMAFLLLGLGIYFLVEAIREKKMKNFAFATGGVVLSYVIALFINYGNISTTNNYTKHTTRGGNDISIAPNGTPAKSSGGLSKGYITAWSYGKDESLTFVSPYVKGSHSYPLALTRFSEIPSEIGMTPQEASSVRGMSLYWGDQSMVAGPFYMGVVVIFLAFLALFIVKDRSKWVYLGVAILCLLLSWGSNLMWLTEFFIDYIPGYNKFRTVTIILVIVELILPVLAVMLLQKLYTEREQIKELKKMFLIASGVFIVFLLGLKFGTPSNYGPKNESAKIEQHVGRTLQDLQMQERRQPGFIARNLGIDPNDRAKLVEFAEEDAAVAFSSIKKVRESMYESSTSRSLLIGLFTIGLCALFFYTSIPSIAIIGGLIVLVLVDLIPVDQNYLGTDEDLQGNMLQWTLVEEKDFPLAPNNADFQIMEAEIEANETLQKKIQEGKQRGDAKAEELGYEGNFKRRIEESYKFQALSLNTNYRVADLSGGSWNSAWNESRASYYHKNFGGYHGAKLRSIQNLFDFHLVKLRDVQSSMQSPIVNMFNIKYFIQGESAVPNPNALGNGWAVKSIKVVDTPNDEIRALGKEFKYENIGSGQFFVNDEPLKTAKIYGMENLKYVLPGVADSVSIPTSDQINKGLEVFVVADVNGNVNFMLEQQLSLDTLNSFTKIVKVTGMTEFKPREEAILLKSEAEKLSQKSFSGDAVVNMTEYKPNKLTYRVEAKGKQLIVFSEVYYADGWTATIDGKSADILKVNYLLRGLEVGNGSHEVVFTYNDVQYHAAKKFAYGGSVLLLLLLGGILFLEFKGRKNKTEVNLEED